MITQKALDAVRDYLNNLASNGEVGTGTTAASVGDTALETPISGTKKVLSSKITGTNLVTFVYNLGAGEANGNTITEFGLWDTNLISRIVFSGVQKTSSISLEAQYAIELSQQNL